METQYDDATNFPGEQPLALLVASDLNKTLYYNSQSSATKKSSFLAIRDMYVKKKKRKRKENEWK